MRRDDIKNILRRAKNRPGEAPGAYIQLIRALILVLLALMVGFSFYAKSALNRNLEQEELLESERARIAARLHGLEDENRHREAVRLFAEKLPIKALDIKHVSGELTVTGRVENRGGRGVNDIELTVYLLGGNVKPIYEQAFTVSSRDGLPLGKYQHRKFRLAVPEVPDGAEDVVVIVTDIEFEKDPS